MTDIRLVNDFTFIHLQLKRIPTENTNITLEWKKVLQQILHLFVLSVASYFPNTQQSFHHVAFCHGNASITNNMVFLLISLSVIYSE